MLQKINSLCSDRFLSYRKDISELALKISEILTNAPSITSFSNYLKAVKGEIHESPRGIEASGYYGLSIVNQVDRASQET